MLDLLLGYGLFVWFWLCFAFCCVLLFRVGCFVLSLLECGCVYFAVVFDFVLRCCLLLCGLFLVVMSIFGLGIVYLFVRLVG